MQLKLENNFIVWDKTLDSFGCEVLAPFKSPFCESVVVTSGVVVVTSVVVVVGTSVVVVVVISVVVVVVISVVVVVSIVVVVVISVVVESISVVLDISSSIQRLSPETQSSQDSSMEGQFWKRTHSGTIE
jgi:hypothetical protein